MKYIYNSSKNPYYNLALEEYLFRNSDPSEDILIIWQNENTIVVGKHQNTIQEINQDFVKNHNINVVRRITGGGAVYHDLGNVNFSFITSAKSNELDFQVLTKPVVSALNKMGVKASFNSRNDLTIDNKKFSGNAQIISKGKLLHHGTILFDSDLAKIQQALIVPPLKIESKAIKSNPNPVTNIKPYLKDEKLTVDDFITMLRDALLESEQIDLLHLSADQQNSILELKKSKYSQWSWNYGESPIYNILKERKFNFGLVSFRILVESGIIVNLKIYGDYFGQKEIDELEHAMLGKKMIESEIKEVFVNQRIEEYIFGMSVNEFVDVVLY